MVQGSQSKGGGIEMQYGVSKKEKYIKESHQNTLEMLNSSVKEMNKNKKVEHWLKTNHAIVSTPLPAAKKKEDRGKIVRKRSTSIESALNSTKMKKIAALSASKEKFKTTTSNKKTTTSAIVIDSTTDNSEDDKPNSSKGLYKKKYRTNENDLEDFQIPNKKRKEALSSGPKSVERKQSKNIKVEPTESVSIKQEDSPLSYLRDDETTQNSTNFQNVETKTELISPKKERISPKKTVVRPASFILKPTGFASTQTDINATNLKELMKCTDVMPVQLKNETLFKFTVNMCNDQFVHRTERELFDRKKNNLDGWYQHILDNYKSKHEYKGKEGCNGFITLDSRFKVMACDDEKQVLTVVEVLTDGSDEDNWMRNIREPIRIHTVLEKERYHLILGENASRLPGLIITRLFPKV